MQALLKPESITETSKSRFPSHMHNYEWLSKPLLPVNSIHEALSLSFTLQQISHNLIRIIHMVNSHQAL